MYLPDVTMEGVKSRDERGSILRCEKLLQSF